MFRVEFHQDVNITVGAEVLSQDGTKQREPADVVPSAEPHKGFLGYGDRQCSRHGHPQTPADAPSTRGPPIVYRAFRSRQSRMCIQARPVRFEHKKNGLGVKFEEIYVAA
jgi:hypothetical protein